MSDAPERVRVSRALLLLFRIQVALFATVVAWLVLVEGVLRVVPLPRLSRAELDPPFLKDDASQRSEPHPYLAYRLRPKWSSPPRAPHQASHNSLGFRGRETTWNKPPGTYRIACLGGSSTYGHTPTSNETTWPARLEHHLRAARPDLDVEVINAGASGYSTFESLVNLEFRVVEFDPDLILVYHGINDMRCALYPNPQVDNTHWRAVWPVPRPSPLEPLLENSMTYLIWRRYCTDWFADRQDLGSYVIVDYEPTDKYVIDLKDYQGFQNFHRNLISLVAVARAHGAEVMFGTQGLDRRDVHGPSREAQLAAMDRMTGILRRVGNTQSVTVVDTATALENEAERQRRKGLEETIFSHEVHLHDDGADLLARTFSRAILEGGVLP